MIVTKISKEDYQQVLDIYNYYIENTTSTFEIEKLNLLEFSKRIESIKEKYPYLVIKDDDVVLGYGYLNYFNERKAYDITCDLSIYINPKICHNGLGSKLWIYLLAEAKKMGLRNIISIITLENDASINFHKKLGFKEVGRLNDVGIKFNRQLDICYFQYKI